MQRELRYRMAVDLVDLVRGAPLSALNDCENGEDRLRHLVAALDRLFPGIQHVRHSEDTEAEIDLNPMSRRDFRLALKKPWFLVTFSG